jgi:DNA repair exonuclease SbcCD ATPase subunit
MKTQMELDEKDLERLKAAIEELKDKEAKGFDVKAYKEDVKRHAKEFPPEVEERLDNLKEELNKTLQEDLNVNLDVSKECDPSEAKTLLDRDDAKISHLHNNMVNAYERTFKQAQDQHRKELREKYKEYVQSLFPESGDLDLPILGNILEHLGNMSFSLKLIREDIKEQDVTEAYTVSTATWYMPWTWFDTETRTRKIGTRQSVDLGELWKNARNKAVLHFDEMERSAKEKIASGHEQLIDEYVAFMTQQFDPLFDKLMQELERNISNKTERERSIAAAKAKLEKIRKFQEDLDNALKVVNTQDTPSH